MTELRDARLRQALQAAPDADARPLPAVADAIRAAARKALPQEAVAMPVAPLPPQWWQRLWHSTGSPRAPWNAAFATLLVGVLVTVLWVREPIPDAQPLAPAPAPKTTTTTTTTTTTPATEAGTANVPAMDPVVKKEAAEPAATRPETAKPDAAQPAIVASALPPQSPLADTVPNPQRTLAATPPVSAEPEPVATPAAVPSPVAAAAPPVASMSRTAPRASQGLPATAALEAADQLPDAIAGLQAWTQLSVQMGPRSATLDRPQGRQLFARLLTLVQRMAQEPITTGTAPTTEPSLQLTVLSQGKPQAVLRLWDGVAMWQRPGQADGLTDHSATEMQAWLLLAEQALEASALPSR